MPRRLDFEAELKRWGGTNLPSDVEHFIHLTQAIDDSIDAQREEGARLARLTKWIIGLTVVLVLLTVVIAILTAVLVQSEMAGAHSATSLPSLDGPARLAL